MDKKQNKFLYLGLRSILTVLVSLTVYSFDSQATIYGELDLVDIQQSQSPYVEYLARSVAVQIRKTSIGENTPYNSRNLRQAMVCEDEPFIDQPVLGSCSGFLVGPQHILTAGHCYLGSGNPCAELSWVFDYTVENDRTSAFWGPKENVYNCEKVEKISYQGDLDYALVKLDRPVAGRAPLKLSSQKQFDLSHPVFSIHSPRGLPLKKSSGFVRDNSSPQSLVMALDLMRGSSGAPIFDAKTGEVLALVAQGDVDYELLDEPFCNKYKRCAEWDCRGERGTRVISIPPAILQNN